MGLSNTWGHAKDLIELILKLMGCLNLDHGFVLVKQRLTTSLLEDKVEQPNNHYSRGGGNKLLVGSLMRKAWVQSLNSKVRMSRLRRGSKLMGNKSLTTW